MLIKDFQLGQMETNCYIVTDEKTLECAVIDPGDESNTILDYIESNNLKVKAVFLTHGHFDHTMAAVTVLEETGAPIYINKKDINPEPEYDDMFTFTAPEGTRYYEEGDKILIGGLTFDVMETPGHTKGSVVLRCERVLFTGDTLFAGAAGRVDFPGGDMFSLMVSLKRLSSLEGDYEVYPGHERTTTLDVERHENPFVQMGNAVEDK